MNSFTRENVIDKIKKLSALAQSQNEGEAAAAAAGIERLMMAHQIEQAELEMAGEPLEEDPMQEDKLIDDNGNVKSTAWKNAIFNYIAKCNNVFAVLEVANIARKKPATLKMFGKRSNIAATKYLYQLMIVTIDRLTDRYSNRTGLTGRSARNDFRMGAVSAIGSRMLDAKREEEAKFKSSNSTALVRVQNDAVEAKSFALSGGMRVTTAAPVRVRASDSYYAGREAGQNVPLSGARTALNAPQNRLR